MIPGHSILHGPIIPPIIGNTGQAMVAYLWLQGSPDSMRKIQMPYQRLFFLVLFLVGCASTPEFNTDGVDLSLKPKQAAIENNALKGKSVLWGGMIIASTNLKESTQLEILAYPLDSRFRPMSDGQALGRFLAVRAGYMETTDFSQGRLITVQGTLGAIRKGYVGESEYVYPVVNIKQLKLWPKEGDYTEPRMRFGIGVMIHN